MSEQLSSVQGSERQGVWEAIKLELENDSLLHALICEEHAELVRLRARNGEDLQGLRAQRAVADREGERSTAISATHGAA